MVCGPGEADRYLEGTLKEFKRLADDAVICLNNATDKERKLINEYGYWHYNDDREWGIHQPSIKTDLLAKISNLRPDVILPLDSDEVFDASFTRAELERWSSQYPACYAYIVNHWNDESHHRKSLGFWNIRLFNWLPQYGTVYQKKNLHCGLGPPWAYHYGSYIPHAVRHYGLMETESRKRKVERYEKYDPSAKWKDRAYYEALKTETVGSEYNEAEMLAKLRSEVEKMGDQTKRFMKSDLQQKYVYVRRLKDGAALDMSEREWAETQKTQPGKFVFIGPADDPTPPSEITAPETRVIQCPICGKELKTKASVTNHKKTHV